MSKTLKFLFEIALVLLVAFILTSCSKMPINGDLDGAWQVMYMEVDGVEVKPAEGAPSCFIYIQRHVVQLARPGVVATGNMYYDHKDKLSFDFPYSVDNETERAQLSYYGIYSKDITYKIIELTRKRLVIESERTRLECRKF